MAVNKIDPTKATGAGINIDLNFGSKSEARSSFDPDSLKKKFKIHTGLNLKYNLADWQKRDLKEAFEIFDSESQGLITLNELRVAFRALGYEPRTNELRYLVSLIDEDGSGNISFNDFLDLMGHKMFEKDTEENLKKSFALLGRDGVVTFNSLKTVAEELGENLTDEQLAEMIHAADSDNDGHVDEADFIKFIKSNWISHD